MKQFETLAAAKMFVESLNIPENEIREKQELPNIFRPLEILLKWADCDIICITNTWTGQNPNRPDDPPYKNVFIVEKRYYGGPISLTECLGMAPKRYKTPVF